MPHPHPTPTDTASIVERLESRIASGDTGLAADAKAEIERLQAALHKINRLIDSPNTFNQEIQDVLDSVIDTSDTRF